jgi:hypothetical protein
MSDTVAKGAATETQRQIFNTTRVRFRDYCDNTAAVLQQFSPPGTNAGNGLWPGEWLGNLERLKIQYNTTDGTRHGPVRYPGVTTPEAAAVDRLLVEFMIRTEGSINQYKDPANASWKNNGHVITDVMNAIVGPVMTIVTNILLLTGGDKKEDRQKAAVEIAKALAAAGEDLKKKGIVSEGSHANGLLAVQMQERMRNFAAFPLDQPATSATSRAMVEIIRKTAAGIGELDTTNQDPWMRPDWQLGYEAVLRSAARSADALELHSG